jgi:hypothetical protein
MNTSQRQTCAVILIALVLVIQALGRAWRP